VQPLQDGAGVQRVGVVGVEDRAQVGEQPHAGAGVLLVLGLGTGHGHGGVAGAGGPVAASQVGGGDQR